MDLIEARKERNFTQWDMAIYSGMSQTKISLIERGYIQPNSGEKSKIASILGVSLDDIEWPEERRL